MAVVLSCRRRSGAVGEVGFTLVELLAAVAIVAILIGITLPVLRGSREQAAAAQARAELGLIAQALEEYRREYGDYPQTGDFIQAAPTTAEEIATSHAQAKLFNALTGVFGPRAFAAADRQNARALLDSSKLTLEIAPGFESGAREAPAAAKRESAACLLDPWGRRYLYYYKCASAPDPWRAPAFILYSAGPDGAHAPPDANGNLPVGPANANSDNVYAFGHDGS